MASWWWLPRKVRWKRCYDKWVASVPYDKMFVVLSAAASAAMLLTAWTLCDWSSAAPAANLNWKVRCLLYVPPWGRKCSIMQFMLQHFKLQSSDKPCCFLHGPMTV
jgi:hypothetical protein